MIEKKKWEIPKGDKKVIKGKETQSNPSDEVQLIDLLLVLWKRKWLIIVGTLICVVTAGIVAFNMPKVYEVSTSMELGKIEDRFSNQFGSRFIGESPVIFQKIKSASLKEKITQELSIPLEEISEEDFLKISSESSEESLVITTKIETDKPEQGIKILEIINQSILKDHQKKIEEAKKEFLDKLTINQSKIKEIEEQIESLEKELSERITLNQAKIKQIELQIQSLEKELSDKITINERWIEIKEEKLKTLEKQLLDIEKEIVALQEIRDRINKEGIEKTDVVGMVAYFNDFQVRLNSLYYTQSQIVDQIPSQIQSYNENIVSFRARLINLDNLPLTIRSYEGEIATLQGRLEKLDGLPLQVQSYKEQIATLEGKLEKIRETKVIDPPHSSYYPVKPQKKIILAVAGIAGLLIFVFLAFFFDYLEKYRGTKT